jgi:L-amino acid N-acyltransferase YncA
MNTRFATADDYESLAPLYAMVQEAHAAAYPHLFKYQRLTRAGLESILQSGRQFIVAEQNGRIVAYVLIEILNQAEDFEHQAHKALLIHNMAMSGGDSGVLFDAAYGYARAQGITDIQLVAWAFNTGIDRWVKGLGYKPLRTRYTMKLGR